MRDPAALAKRGGERGPSAVLGKEMRQKQQPNAGRADLNSRDMLERRIKSSTDRADLLLKETWAGSAKQ
jgi:hypothetical protein